MTFFARKFNERPPFYYEMSDDMPLKHHKTKKASTVEQQSYDDERSYLTPLRASSHRDGHTNRDKDVVQRKPITLAKLKFMEFKDEW